ncbi:substrate-binding domain-containing protein [Leptothoe kymatousa]|uniref:Substrate-binding domain-containing protein n=1 Tax=Leptothoe kymatousa TAU-MAC 1615 TaxID=2364775 RepID=A0ABS5Y5Q0_9CYAN|nr:substrate-binding domain-containing protein [Leptothoe kymatousa]MBT9313174.1 substrate-binding domain-containing protein [Leptothoe kymatousa TAU-MAC 1615]
MVLTQRRLSSLSQRSIVVSLALVLALSAFPQPATAMSLAMVPVAQTSGATGQVGNTVVNNKNVANLVTQGQGLTIDGSQLMQPINQALKESFEQEYPGTDVTLRTNGTEPALDALLNNDIDLAAIGRSLSATEKAKGLVEIPVSQDAISIIIGRNNRFTGHLTLEQFAQIFRGEITDWSEVGGTPGPIRFIDRPLASDTRAVLGTYGILGTAERAQGERVVQLKTDNTAEVIRQLDDDGISYAIASQIKGQRRVKPVKMAILQDTLPGEQAYPYAQIRGYAYKKNNAKAVLPFVNWVTGASGKAAIGAGKTAEAAAIATALNPPMLATDAATSGGNIGFIPWLLGLLPLPFLFLLWGQRRSAAESTSPKESPFAEIKRPETKPAAANVEAKPAAPTAPKPIAAKPVAPKPIAPPPPAKPAAPKPAVAAPPLASAPKPAAPIKPQTVPTPPIKPAAAPMPVAPRPTSPPTVAKPINTTPGTTLSIVPFEKTAGWNNAEQVAHKGFEYLKSEQADKAEAYFQRALELSPRNLLGLLGLGSVFLTLKQGENALAQFNQATEIDPGNIDGWIGKGKALTSLGQADAALGDFDRALQLNKTSIDALKAKGDACLALGQLDEANGWYGEANALLSGTPIPTWKPGSSAQTVMVTSPTKAPVAPAAPTAPAATHSTENAGVAQTAGSAEPKAVSAAPSDDAGHLATIRQLVNWNDPEAICQKGLYYQSLGRSKEAEYCFRRVLELSGHNVTAMIGLGQIVLDAGQADHALTLFNQAVELAPNSPKAWIGQGDALMALGRGDAAKQSYARAWGITPETANAKLSPKTVISPTAVISPTTLRSPAAIVSQPVSQPLVSQTVVAPPEKTPAPPLPVAPPAPASYVAPSTPQLLDMVILVDSQAPNMDITAMERVMGDVLSATHRPTDTRVTWLGTHGTMAGTPVHQSVPDYLGSLGKVSDTPDGVISSAEAMATIAQHFDWRPGAAQSLLFVGAQGLHNDNNEKTAVQSVVQAANGTGTIVSTYLYKPADEADRGAIAAHKELAMATGGLAFVNDGNTPMGDVLGQTIEKTCRECVYRRLTIRSHSDCLSLDPARLQSFNSARSLSPGKYIIRINSGTFSYWPDAPTFEPEPWVMLWINGGRFINQDTNVAVGTTWLTLNGYNDVLKLEVLADTHLCALFLDTYKDDNVGQITLSIVEAG